jgi:hypothetical protein
VLLQPIQPIASAGLVTFHLSLQSKHRVVDDSRVGAAGWHYQGWYHTQVGTSSPCNQSDTGECQPPYSSAYFRIPFAGMISFFAIYLGLAENKNMSRFVRFNAMQAIILDICMVLPGRAVMPLFTTTLFCSQITVL